MTGPTSSSLWAAVTEAQDFMLLKSRGDVHLMLEHASFRAGSTAPPTDESMVGAIVRAREDYKRAFLSAPN